MRLARVLASVATALGPTLAFAIPSHAADAKVDAKGPPALHEFHLDNGLTVVVAEVPRVPIETLALRYDGGQRAVPAGMSGLATLTTELMLEQTRHVHPGDYARLLTTAGASKFNWTNGIDATVLEVTLPSSRVELPLWLWSDEMGFFSSGFDDTQFAKLRAEQQQRRSTWLASSRCRVSMHSSKKSCCRRATRTATPLQALTSRSPN